MTATATTELRLAADLTLPADVVTRRMAIVGRSGSGKTTTAVDLAEEMIRASLPVVVLDPLGAWWGLRTNAAGDGDGLPVVIFGGDHADVPLGPDSAELIADIIIDERPHAVLDLSDLDSDADIRRWSAAFLKRLYRRNRDPLHVIVDEADLLAPQQGAGDAAHSLNAMKNLVRRGRIRGLGATLITQRPASLAKEVLTQAEVLIAMQLTGPTDIVAVSAWMSDHADNADNVREIKASLPSLDTGEAWVWSPSWLKARRRVRFRPRDTFDSSATPKLGEVRAVAKRMAAVDIARITELLAGASDDHGPPDDAGALRRRVAVLERQLAEAKAAVPEPREVPVLTDDDRALVRELCDRIDVIGHEAAELRGRLDGAQHRAGQDCNQAGPAPRRKRTRAPAAPGTSGAAATNGDGDGDGLKAGAVRMLDALARQHPMRITRAQLATLGKVKRTGGTFTTYFGALRNAGYLVERDGYVTATDAGRARVGRFEADPLTTDELRDQYRSLLKAGARTMLDELIAAYPESLDRDALAERAGITRSGGTFTTYLGALRQNGLAEVARSSVRAADILFSNPADAR